MFDSTGAINETERKEEARRQLPYGPNIILNWTFIWMDLLLRHLS